MYSTTVRIVVPADQLPGPLAAIASALPSGALGESLRAALGDGVLAAGPLAVLAAWAVVGAVLTARTFSWE